MNVNYILNVIFHTKLHNLIIIPQRETLTVVAGYNISIQIGMKPDYLMLHKSKYNNYSIPTVQKPNHSRSSR